LGLEVRVKRNSKTKSSTPGCNGVYRMETVMRYVGLLKKKKMKQKESCVLGSTCLFGVCVAEKALV
jgi:hypothetical protein